MDPIVCALSECTRTVFSYVWADDGSFEPKYVAEFLILITIYIYIYIYVYSCIVDWNKLLVLYSFRLPKSNLHSLQPQPASVT